jgi:hypothetical protein
VLPTISANENGLFTCHSMMSIIPRKVRWLYQNELVAHQARVTGNAHFTRSAEVTFWIFESVEQDRAFRYCTHCIGPEFQPESTKSLNG